MYERLRIRRICMNGRVFACGGGPRPELPRVWDGNRRNEADKVSTEIACLVEKEAATGGEGNWFAKQGLRAHNLGRRRELAATEISRYSSLNACALHSSVHSPEPLDEFAFHRWGGLVCIVTSVSLRSRRTSFFFADPRWWRL